MFTAKTALVTGAASGIGLAVARHLASEGIARLILCDIDGEALISVSHSLTGPEIAVRQGDGAQEAFWDRLAPDCADVDLAVLNAGISTSGMIADLDFAEWRRTLSINLDGTFLGLRAVMRAMRAHGRGGAIVLTGSAAGLKAEPGVAAYGASKAAVHHLTKGAAKEGAPQRIRVNAIAPGGVETPIWSQMDFFRDMVARTGSEAAAFAELAGMATPLGRYAKPEEIAAQIAFLLSEQSDFVTGVIFPSDGGYTA
jgi:2-keto-3-deoxy-L-fuconate dehydrogenase